jgi:hypothetical protein
MRKWKLFLFSFVALVALPERPLSGGVEGWLDESLTLITNYFITAPPLCLDRQVRHRALPCILTMGLCPRLEGVN